MRITGAGGIPIDHAIFSSQAACVELTLQDPPEFQENLPVFEKGHPLFGKHIPTTSLAHLCEPFCSFVPSQIERSLKALKAQNALLHSSRRHMEEYRSNKAAKAKTAYEKTLYSLTSQQIDTRIAQLEPDGSLSKSRAHAYWLLGHKKPATKAQSASQMGMALIKPGSDALNNYGQSAKKALEEAKDSLDALFTEHILANRNEGQRNVSMQQLCADASLIHRTRIEIQETLSSLWRYPELLLHPSQGVRLPRKISEILPSEDHNGRLITPSIIESGASSNSLEESTESVWLSTDQLWLPFDKLAQAQAAYFDTIQKQEDEARKKWTTFAAWFATLKTLIAFIPLVGGNIVAFLNLPSAFTPVREIQKNEQFGKENLIRIQLRDKILPALLKVLKGKGVLKMSTDQVKDIKSAIGAQQDHIFTAFNNGAAQLQKELDEVKQLLVSRSASSSPDADLIAENARLKEQLAQKDELIAKLINKLG